MPAEPDDAPPRTVPSPSADGARTAAGREGDGGGRAAAGVPDAAGSRHPGGRAAARRHASPDDGPHLRRSRRVVEALFGPPGERVFDVRYWDAGRERGGRDPAFTLVLTGPGALRRMLLPPTERSLGDAFVREDVAVEGDLEAAVGAGRAALRGLASSPRRAARLARELWRLPRDRDRAPAPGAPRGAPAREGRRHSRDRDARSVRYHYDLGNDFYRLWLDRWMQYSCGYFADGAESLREAQEAKLELICRKLGLRPGHRLVDVGCGWGGLVHWAAERHGVEAVGLTLSEPQARAARERLREAGLADRCRVRVLDYRELERLEPFDRAASVGMVEHVGRRQMGRYLRHVGRALAPGGLFLNQGIVTLDDTPTWRRRLRERLTAPWSSFVQRHVFPDGELVTPAERLDAAHGAGFELRSTLELREHYAETLRRWVRRLEDRRREAIAEVGRATFRVWRLYMAGSARAFDAGEIGVLQELHRKPEREDGRGREGSVGPGGRQGGPTVRS